MLPFNVSSYIWYELWTNSEWSKTIHELQLHVVTISTSIAATRYYDCFLSIFISTNENFQKTFSFVCRIILTHIKKFFFALSPKKKNSTKVFKAYTIDFLVLFLSLLYFFFCFIWQRNIKKLCIYINNSELSGILSLSITLSRFFT